MATKRVVMRARGDEVVECTFCGPNELASTLFAVLSGGTGFQAFIGYKFGCIIGYTER